LLFDLIYPDKGNFHYNTYYKKIFRLFYLISISGIIKGDQPDSAPDFVYRFSAVSLKLVSVQAEDMYARNTPLNRMTTGIEKQKQIAAIKNPTSKISLEPDITPTRTGAIIKHHY